MPANLDLNLDVKGKHIVGTAAVWRSPDLLHVILSNGFKFTLLMVVLHGCNSVVSSFSENVEKQNKTKAGYERMLKKCQLVQLEKYGNYDHTGCHKWANAKYRAYAL